MEEKSIVTKVYCYGNRKHLKIPAVFFKNFFVDKKLYFRCTNNLIEFSFYPSVEFRKIRKVYRCLIKLPSTYDVSKNNKAFWSLEEGKLVARIYDFSGSVGKKAFEVVIHL